MNIIIKINKMLIVAALLLTFSVVSEAAEFSIGNYTVNEGEQITGKIELKDVVNFGTVTISLLYDPSVVQVTTVSNGNIPATTMANNINYPVNGSTRILVRTSDVSGPNGNFVLSNINLKAVGNGGSQSFLSISIQEFVDPDGRHIDYTVLNGTFSIKSSEIRNVTVTPTISSMTPAETEKPPAETPVSTLVQTFPTPSPKVPGFSAITFILTVLCVYFILKKNRSG
ncbi:MAG TPA: cohesin domain-containing protein [Candidatus Methanoperedens sp.]